MKKKWLIYSTVLMLGFLLGFKSFVHYYPNILFLGAQNKIGGVENVPKHAKLPDDTSRFVVKPNPDFLYTSCFYNLNEGSLLIEADFNIESYWSVAFYEPNTVNFYVKNNQQWKKADFRLLLTAEEVDENILLEGVETIRSPDVKGLILFRFLVTDTSAHVFSKIEHAQKSIRIRQLIRNQD